MKKHLLPATALAVVLVLVLFAPATAFSANPTSGALLTITSTDKTVNLAIYDSQIHTGTVQTPPCDSIPTDAYVLQGGSSTGCDQGDVLEVAQGTPGGHATLVSGPYTFAITTQYLINSVDVTHCTSAGVTPSICAGPDTGFLTVTNTGAAFTGTITLSGTALNPAGINPIYCPAGGTVSDSFSGTLSSDPGSVTLALSTDSSNCGGFNQGQKLQLALNTPSTFLFGNDLYIFTPTSALTGTDFLTVTPIPVPTGFTQSITVALIPSALVFNPGSAFPNEKAIPFADFSAPGNPVTPELQLDCSGPDCGSILYASEVGYDIDNSSIPSGLIGGPGLIGDHLDECATSGFSFNTITSFTSPDVPPLTKGGGKGNSCFAVTWDPNQPVIPPNTTISTFSGFEGFVSDTKINPIANQGFVPEILIWDSNDSSGNPIPNLRLCKAVNPLDGTCATLGVIPPWVHLSLAPIANCPVSFTGVDPLPSFLNFGLLHGDEVGEYVFPWNTRVKGKNLTGCQVTVVLQFDTGAFVNPATFQYVF